jgi:hypothetical protein
MANSGLFGPYPLTEGGIDARANGKGPGAYALGRSGDDGTYYISYVGRSDSDLNARLKSHIGNYNEFKHAFYPSAKAAFEKECHLFHDFGETTLDNKVHPARPQGTDWKCPRCKVFD